MRGGVANRRIAILLLAVFVLAGCSGDDVGGSTSDLSTFDSTTAMADALNKAGIECDGFEVESEEGGADAIELGLPTPAEVGHCSSNGDHVLVSYRAPDDVAERYELTEDETDVLRVVDAIARQIRTDR